MTRLSQIINTLTVYGFAMQELPNSPEISPDQYKKV